MALKVILTLTVEFIVFAALLFGAAGTLAWPQAWVFLAVFVATAVWITVRLAHDDPALLAERMKSPVQKGQPLWDRLFVPGMIIAWCGWLVLMGLDAARFRWSAVPVWLECAGGALMLVSFLMMARVIRENTFLAAVVRIQKERGHHVISTGPYAIVRHPLYACMLLYLPSMALLLGSCWGLAASTVILAGLVYRTAREDAELHRGLEGYSEYAAKVRYRLAPFIW